MRVSYIRSPGGGAPPPNQVTGLTATVNSSSQITLNWTPIVGATSYNVQLFGTLLSSPVTASFVNSGLSGSTTYSYSVSAVIGGIEGTRSAIVSATTTSSATVPGAPTSVVGTRGNAQVSVAFAAAAANGSPITSYTATSVPGAFTATGAGSPLIVAGLTNGTAYTFTVTATNAVGTGPASTASASVTPATVPSAPTIGAATGGDSQATVTFTDNSTGGSAITGHTVTSSPGGLTGTGVSPVTVAGLTNGTAYTFTVIATNAIGTSAASAASNSVTPTVAVGGPTAPTDFFVTLQGQTSQGSSTFRTGGGPSYNVPNAGQIAFGWPNAVAGSFAIGHYEIQRSTDGGTTWVNPTGGTSIGTGAANAQGTRFTDTGCATAVSSTYGPTSGQYLPYTVYLHRLRAVDTNGTASAWVTGANQYCYYGNSGGASNGTGGYKWGGDLSSGYPINYAVTDATYGYVMTVDMSAAGGGYFLPTTGANYCTYNQAIGSCDYFYFELKTTNAGMAIAFHTEVVGDLKMMPGGAPVGNYNGTGDLLFAKYVAGGTVVANTYQQYKIPLSHIQVPQSGWAGVAAAVGVQQLAFYKFLMQAGSGAVVTFRKIWFGK